MTGATRGFRAAGAAAAVIAAAAALLAGCAHVEREPLHDGLSFEERRQRLNEVTAWEMRGRLAVNTGERAFQGGFSWRQNDAHSTLVVRGPLGGGVLEVTGSPESMVVTARGERRELEDPETELSAMLGWWMPVESLGQWLLGLPDPAHGASTRFGANAALEALDQRLWHVEYASYQLADGVLVPRRIDMAHDTLELRLTVDAWQPAADGDAPAANGGDALEAGAGEVFAVARRLELRAARPAQYPR